MEYFISTYGCQANEADSERIEARLQLMSYKKTASEKTADLIIVNACSVRQSAIDRVLAQVKKHKKNNKRIILAGCILKSDKKKFQNLVDEIWHPDEYFDLKPARSDKHTAFVPIMTGCNNFRTYCAVPFTRGRERSRPAKEIIKEIKELVHPAGQKQKEYREIWLLGQNVNSYKSGKITFPKLLVQLSAAAGNCTLHFMSPHPKDFSDELIKVIAKNDNISKEIHLPLQSGDNEILKRMNRNYTKEHYLRLIKKIRKSIPKIKISTDAIVGFPGETKKQFENTVNLFKQADFYKAYISRYSPRVGTLAAKKMKDDISQKEKKRRWKILNDLVNSSTPLGTNKKTKIITVIGPTASGKSALAIEIARKFNGEVVSADSRQIYTGMDIGTGKVTKKEMKGIKHYLIDVATPEKIFTTMNFKEKAEKSIKKITKKGKTPIVCGGTGFYINALLGNSEIPKIKPDWVLRKKLEKKSAEELFKMLEKLNPKRAKNIDAKNKRRLIRAVEIARCGKSDSPQYCGESDFDVLWIGIKKEPEELRKIIDKRVDKMLKLGLEKEIKKLVKKHGWTKVLKNTIGYQEFYSTQMERSPKLGTIEKIKLHTIQYAKRQMTWFKKFAPKTKWLALSKVEGIKNKKESFKLVEKFLFR